MIFILCLACAFGNPPELLDCEGDQGLLRSLYVHQLANEGQFPKGEMRVHWKSNCVGTTGTEDVKCKVYWDGEAAGWDYARTTQYAGIKRQTAKPVLAKRLATPKGYFVQKLGKSQGFDSYPSSPIATDEFLAIRPKDLWFKYRRTRPWSDFLLRSKYPAEEYRSKLRQDGDLLVLERKTIDSGLTTEVVFSRSQGWNVIRYEFPVGQPRNREAGSILGIKTDYEWKQVENSSSWSLSRMYSTETYPPARGGGSARVVTQEVLISDFTPSPKWGETFLTPSRFFTIGNNTMVTEHATKGVRRYRHGEGNSTRSEALDDLARELKSRGFGKPN